jgi:hypothetical protein
MSVNQESRALLGTMAFVFGFTVTVYAPFSIDYHRLTAKARALYVGWISDDTSP